MIKTKIITLTGVALIVLPAAPALADHGSTDGLGSSGSSTSTTSGSGSNTSPTTSTSSGTETHSVSGTDTRGSIPSGTSEDKKITSAKPEKGATNSKQKACKKKQNGVSTRMKRMAARGQKQLETFSNIATRTESFYTTKKLSVANYDALVGAVNSAKNTATQTVTKVNSDSVNFNCKADNPTSQTEAFQADVKAENTALFNYRKAVKNLLTTVRAAAATKEAQHESH